MVMLSWKSKHGFLVPERQPIDVEYNSGEVLNEQRRSLRLKDIVERAMRGAPLDTDTFDDLDGASPEELNDWVTHPQYEPDYIEAFEASERVGASLQPLPHNGSNSTEPDKPATSGAHDGTDNDNGSGTSL